MTADPTNWSDEKLEAHAREWANLPEFPQWPYVMGDDDVEAWGDILYMRGLVDDLLALAHTTHGAARQAESMLARPVLDDQDADVLDFPWHADAAGDTLRAWRIRLDAERDWAAWWLAEQRRAAESAKAVA